MCSACVVRTRFVLNDFSGIGLGVPGRPLGYAHAPADRILDYCLGCDERYAVCFGPPTAKNSQLATDVITAEDCQETDLLRAGSGSVDGILEEDS